MTLRIIRFIECQLDDNWYFAKEKSGKRVIVTSSSWIKTKDKIISARTEGARIGVSVGENHSITIKFRKGAEVELNDELLVYDMADAL